MDANTKAKELLSENLTNTNKLSDKDKSRIANYLINNEEVKKYIVGLIADIGTGQPPTNEFEVQKLFWIKYQGECLLESIIYEANQYKPSEITEGTPKKILKKLTVK